MLKDFKGDARDIFGEGGLLKTIGKRALEAALEGELTHHLGYPPHDRSGRGSGNSRNGRTAKRLESESGSLDLEVPRDRNGSFEPRIVEKRQRRVAGLDDVIVYLYAQGQSTRAIQDTLKRLYGAEVSSTLVSEVTASVLEEVKAWQARPLQKVYPIVYFDALMVKSREEGSVKTRAVYVALAIDMDGEKEALGLWLAPAEGASSWLAIFGELKARGMEDCFIACVDGLRGLPEAIETVFPHARVQLCIVHQVRKSLRYVPWKERKAVAASLRAVYAAPSEEAALAALEAFERQWSEKYPAIAPLWRKDWERLAPFFDYAPAIRKVVYTTNAIESLNYSLRKIVKGRGAFPNDDVVRKLLYLGLREASKKWKRPIRDWKAALNQFVILYGDRVPMDHMKSTYTVKRTRPHKALLPLQGYKEGCPTPQSGFPYHTMDWPSVHPALWRWCPAAPCAYHYPQEDILC